MSNQGASPGSSYPKKESRDDTKKDPGLRSHDLNAESELDEAADTPVNELDKPGRERFWDGFALGMIAALLAIMIFGQPRHYRE